MTWWVGSLMQFDGEIFRICLMYKGCNIVTGREMQMQGEAGVEKDYGASRLVVHIIDHHINFHLLNDFSDISDTLILIQKLTHYDSYSLEHIPLLIDQVIGSIIFHFYLNFPMMSHCVHFITIFFLIYHLICHVVLWWNFLEDSVTSLMRNRLQISEMLLSHQDSPMYKEAVCLRERQSSSGFILSSAIFSKAINSTVLITASGFTSNSHQGLNHFDYIIRVCSSYFIKLTSA